MFERDAFHASLEFHDGDRLTFLEIVRSLDFDPPNPRPSQRALPRSWWKTASQTRVLAPRDKDARFRIPERGRDDVADGPVPTDRPSKHFHGSMLVRRKNSKGMLHYERSAKALREAVQKVWRKKIHLARWVNFVHTDRVTWRNRA
ncbi:hypothetical protein EI94DRAFT_1727332 [Lactarius quietus]|nr:hypothetical protein EI94DRAFT_1727332 [Lactarius quietus]